MDHAEIEIAAYREAGHAVVALHFKIAVKRANATDSIILKTLKTSQAGSMYPLKLADAQKRAMVSVAGQEAVRLSQSGSVKPRDAQAGQEDARSFLRDHASSPEELEAHIQWLTVRVRDLLRLGHIWAQVEALVEYLAEEQTLNSPDLFGICEASSKNYLHRQRNATHTF